VTVHTHGKCCTNLRWCGSELGLHDMWAFKFVGGDLELICGCGRWIPFDLWTRRLILLERFEVPWCSGVCGLWGSRVWNHCQLQVSLSYSIPTRTRVKKVVLVSEFLVAPWWCSGVLISPLKYSCSTCLVAAMGFVDRSRWKPSSVILVSMTMTHLRAIALHGGVIVDSCLLPASWSWLSEWKYSCYRIKRHCHSNVITSLEALL
jgi:hypothetical protein